MKIVFAINLVMFFTEFGGGLLARSTALLADSLDMFGDATVYAVSLYVLHRGERWQARAAFLKGCVMAGFGVTVLVEVVHKVTVGVVPVVSLMSMFGLLALLANTACAIMLLRFRTGESNMRSTWVCSRNDVIANLGVVFAALGVAATAIPTARRRFHIVPPRGKTLTTVRLLTSPSLTSHATIFLCSPTVSLPLSHHSPGGSLNGNARIRH